MLEWLWKTGARTPMKVIPRMKNEPVVLEILGISIRTIAAAAMFIPKLFPSAV